MSLSGGIVSDFQKEKKSGVLANDFPTIDEKDETHQVVMEIEQLLLASGY